MDLWRWINWREARRRAQAGQLTPGELAYWSSWAVLTAGAVGFLIGLVEDGSALGWAISGALFGAITAVLQLATGDRRFVKWIGRLVVMLILFAVVGGIYAGRSSNQKPGCLGFATDAQGEPVTRREVPCGRAQWHAGGTMLKGTAALLGTVREKGGARGDLLHVCVGLTRLDGETMTAGETPAMRLAGDTGNIELVAIVQETKVGFRCGDRRIADWPGLVLDALFLVPGGEHGYALEVGELPPARIDLRHA